MSLRYLIIIFSAVFFYSCAQKEHVFDISKYTWPKESANPKIQAVRVIVNSEEFPNKKDTKNQLIKELIGDIDIKWINIRAIRMATNGSDRIYIVSPIDKLLQIIDFRKKDIEEITFSNIMPSAIALSKDERIFLADRSGGRVLELSKDKKVLWSYGKKVSEKESEKVKKSKESENTQESSLEGLYKDISDIYYYDNKIYVTDQIIGRIDILSTDGRLIKSIKNVPAPNSIVVDEKRNEILVVSKFVGKVLVYDFDGKLKEELLQPGDNLWALNFPNGIALDSEGHIYIVDIAAHGFKIYDRKGNFLYYMGDQKPSVYLGGFDNPKDIVIDEKDRIYVLDSINRRVVVFQYLSNLYKEIRKNLTEPEPMLRY